VLSHICLFLSCVLGVFNNPAVSSAHELHGFSRIFDYYIYMRTRACLLCIFVPPPKGRSHFTKLLTRALFFVPCHYSYIFVPFLAFHVHVAGDLNETISFVAGILSTLLARALLRLIQ